MYLQLILFILIIKLASIDCINNSTVCYGSAPACTTHRLSCPSSLVIQIINTSYGYRPGCNDVIGQTSCSNTKCCEEKSRDCLIPFSYEDDQQVKGNCNGLKTCEIRGLRRFDQIDTVCNGREISAYSRILYDCVSNDSLTTASMIDSTPHGDAEDVTGSIVGGIFGAIIIIVIVIVVAVFLYKRKTQLNKEKTSATVTPQYNVIDGPGTINNRKDTSEYDEIELDSAQATSVHLHQSTIHTRVESSRCDDKELGRKPNIQKTDNYDHVGDDKLKITSQKELDNYNRIGSQDHFIHEDNYNHIGNNLSPSSHHLETDYNHINGVRGTFNDEDDYNHIGDNDNKIVITDDNYHHIGSGDIKVEGDYNHIGSDGDDHDNHRNYDNDDINHGQDDSEAPYNLASC